MRKWLDSAGHLAIRLARTQQVPGTAGELPKRVGPESDQHGQRRTAEKIPVEVAEEGEESGIRVGTKRLTADVIDKDRQRDEADEQ